MERPLGWGKTEQLALNLKYSESMYSNDSFNLKKNNYTINIREALKNCTLDGSNKITLWTEDRQKQKHSVNLKNFDQKDYSRAL